MLKVYLVKLVAATESVGLLNLLQVVDTEQIRQRMHYSLFHCLDQPTHICFLAVVVPLFNHLNPLRILVHKVCDLSKDLINLLFLQNKILVKHFFKINFFLLIEFTLVTPHTLNL